MFFALLSYLNDLISVQHWLLIRQQTKATKRGYAVTRERILLALVPSYNGGLKYRLPLNYKLCLKQR